MRSFHLETVAANVFSSLGGNYRDALQKYFVWAPSHLLVSYTEIGRVSCRERV